MPRLSDYQFSDLVHKHGVIIALESIAIIHRSRPASKADDIATGLELKMKISWSLCVTMELGVWIM